MSKATAPGKIILLGEHAVVYHSPALAVPVRQVQAQVVVEDFPQADRQDIWIESINLERSYWLSEAEPDDPPATMLALSLSELDVNIDRPIRVKIDSTIPIAAGLGSGAAVSVALGRAVGAYFGRPFDHETLSAMVFEVEKLHHGTPSGIDNTVITYDRPVFFVRGSVPETLTIGGHFTLVIADSGIQSSTAEAVGLVRSRWQDNQELYDGYFDQIAQLVRQGREAIEAGQAGRLGSLMDENHVLLNAIGVGLPILDRLAEAARSAGAWGAKLSGAGLGGNCIALVQGDLADPVMMAMRKAGAVWTLRTEVAP